MALHFSPSFLLLISLNGRPDMIHLRISAAALVAALAPALALAQAGAPYPTKRIEVVVSGNPGGGIDATARAMERGLAETRLVSQPLVMNNMSGAAGDVAKLYVSQKKGDPYFLYVESNRIYQNKLLGTTQVGIDEVTPIARLLTEYLVWAVLADAPYKGPRDVLDRLKADPGSVAFGVGAIPNNDYFNIVRPARAYGIDYQKLRVASFKSGGNVMIQLLGGHVPVIATSLSEAIDQVKSGKVKLLVSSAPKAMGGDLKGVPTWRDQGIDVSILHWRGVFAAPGIPKEVIAYWDERMAKMVRTDSWKKSMEQYGWYEAYADSATFKRELEAEREVTGKLLKELGYAK
jgi:putative tricarboxylic transport membrane protein